MLSKMATRARFFNFTLLYLVSRFDDTLAVESIGCSTPAAQLVTKALPCLAGSPLLF